MRKKYKVISIFVILLGLSIYIHSQSMKYEPELKEKIKFHASNSKSFELSSLTDFQWDKMFAFSPYTKYKEVLKNNNIKIPILASYNLTTGDDNTVLIIFTYKSKIVSYLYYDYKDGCFAITNRNRFISKDKSTFIVEKSNKKIIFKPKYNDSNT